MTERNNGRERISWPGRICITLLGVLLCGCVYLSCVLLQPEEGAAPVEISSVTRLQAGDFTDLQLLEDSFGAALPRWENATCKGQTRNAEYDGAAVRRADVTYSNGIHVSCVMPPKAAPLLRDESATLLLNTDVAVMDTPCALARDGKDFAAYFTYGQAAYAIYMKDTDEESFLLLLSGLQIH